MRFETAGGFSQGFQTNRNVTIFSSICSSLLSEVYIANVVYFSFIQY